MFYYIHVKATSKFSIFPSQFSLFLFFNFNCIRPLSTLINCKRKNNTEIFFFFFPAGTELDIIHNIHLNTLFALPFPVQSDGRHILAKKKLQTGLTI